jgi:isoquinoline 1-oxidoreductase beta subunit
MLGFYLPFGLLEAAAAKGWNVPPSACRAENGLVIQADGRKMGYGDMVDQAAVMPVPVEVKLKNPGAYKILGQPRVRLDSPAKINGTARFGFDVNLPSFIA